MLSRALFSARRTLALGMKHLLLLCPRAILRHRRCHGVTVSARYRKSADRFPMRSWNRLPCRCHRIPAPRHERFHPVPSAIGLFPRFSRFLVQARQACQFCACEREDPASPDQSARAPDLRDTRCRRLLGDGRFGIAGDTLTPMPEAAPSLQRLSQP